MWTLAACIRAFPPGRKGPLATVRSLVVLASSEGQGAHTVELIQDGPFQAALELDGEERAVPTVNDSSDAPAATASFNQPG